MIKLADTRLGIPTDLGSDGLDKYMKRLVGWGKFRNSKPLRHSMQVRVLSTVVMVMLQILVWAIVWS